MACSHCRRGQDKTVSSAVWTSHNRTTTTNKQIQAQATGVHLAWNYIYSRSGDDITTTSSFSNWLHRERSRLRNVQLHITYHFGDISTHWRENPRLAAWDLASFSSTHEDRQIELRLIKNATRSTKMTKHQWWREGGHSPAASCMGRRLRLKNKKTQEILAQWCVTFRSRRSQASRSRTYITRIQCSIVGGASTRTLDPAPRDATAKYFVSETCFCAAAVVLDGLFQWMSWLQNYKY